jgi:hypothetical protein
MSSKLFDEEGGGEGGREGGGEGMPGPLEPSPGSKGGEPTGGSPSPSPSPSPGPPVPGNPDNKHNSSGGTRG